MTLNNNDSGMIEFEYDGNHVMINYIVFNDELVGLTEKDSGKIAYFTDNASEEVEIDVDGEAVSVKISFDQDSANTALVFEALDNEGSNYFSDLDDSLVVIKFNIQ